MKQRALRDREVVKPETRDDLTVTLYGIPMTGPGILERAGDIVIERRYLRQEVYPASAVALVTAE